MRQTYVHTAVLDVDAVHERAPGGAVTAALCGHWEHEPPCPLAPHHTATTRQDDGLHLRIVFATEPERAAEARQQIVTALTAGHLDLVDPPASWVLLSDAIAEPTDADRSLAAGFDADR